MNVEARARAAERRRAETRSRLIQAALEVIARRGADAPVFEEVAGTAGVSRATVYNYFPSNDDLLTAVVEHFGQATAAEMNAILGEIDDPARALAAWCAQFVRKAADEPAWAWLFLHLGVSGTPPHRRPAERFAGIVLHGVGSGRFRPCEMEPMWSLFHGSFRFAMRRTLRHEAPITHALDVMELILAALGIDPAEAREICVEAAQARGLA